MFCPRCGQERISQATSFCSRCGYLLTATADLLLSDGIPGPDFQLLAGDTSADIESPRWRGVKQGIFLMMLAIVLAPVLGLIFRFGFNMMPWPMGLIVFLLGGSGLLRIAYALMFEPRSGNALPGSEALRKPYLAGGQPGRELSEGDAFSYLPPDAIRVGRWADTSDLEPHSVTDATTKLLEKEQDDLIDEKRNSQSDPSGS